MVIWLLNKKISLTLIIYLSLHFQQMTDLLASKKSQIATSSNCFHSLYDLKWYNEMMRREHLFSWRKGKILAIRSSRFWLFLYLNEVSVIFVLNQYEINFWMDNICFFSASQNISLLLPKPCVTVSENTILWQRYSYLTVSSSYRLVRCYSHDHS